jgi:hypothetical protein
VEDVLPGQVWRFHASADGALWLITDKGVARRRGETWHAYVTDLSGHLVGVDAAGRAWVVSEETEAIAALRQAQDGDGDGLSRTVYGGESGWVPIALEDGWHREIGPLQSDAAGQLWLATSQDVRRFDGEGWTVFTPAEMSMGEVGPQELWPTFTVGIARRSGTVWVGSCDWGGPGPFGGQGVRWFDGKAWRGADSPAGSGCATAIAEDGQGRVWMGVDHRLWRYDPASDGWGELAPPEPPVEGMRFGFVHALTLDRSDDPWPAMVLCGGASCYGKIVLYQIRGVEWAQIGEVMEFGGGLPPHELVSDGAGTRWLLWTGSLYRVSEGLSGPVRGLGLIHDIAVDGAGRLWLVAEQRGRDVLWTLDPA